MQNAKRILIVDDEKLVVQALTQKLQQAGFRTEAAFDGKEALAKINQSKPDLVLLDIIMPKLDGISMLKKLKASDKTKNIPIIILTNLYSDKKVVQALESGGTDYLIKVEYSLTEIVDQVRKKLQ
jgi:PleD family two-component response regulator